MQEVLIIVMELEVYLVIKINELESFKYILITCN